MPFVTPFLYNYSDKHFANPKKFLPDEHTFAFDCIVAGKKITADTYPADFTARAHIVSKSINPEYYKLIKAFENETGLGAVLNTSFNLHGYPIVCTPYQAVHVFNNSDLDAMILEDILVLRKR
jgi:carbamoyltransferase